MRKTPFIAALFGCLLMVGTASAQQSITEEETNTTFQVKRNIGGIPHILVGVGAREALGTINVYGAGMYVGETEGAKAWGGYVNGRFAKANLVSNGNPDFSKIAKSAEGRHYMVYGRMPRALELAFVRDVRADQIAEAYEDSWERVRLDRAAAGDALTQFMAAVNHPANNGQRMMVRTNGNTIWVTMPGQSTTRIAGNRAMTIALWKVYFGDPPFQRRLREGLMSLLQNVHTLFTASQS